MDDKKVSSRNAPAEKFTSKRVQLYKHWVRPRFLQYSYMYDYRLNYYDDVIDYLDNKKKGIKQDIPKPQTWAERVLRTLKDKPHTSAYEDFEAAEKDPKHDNRKITITNQINSYNYHSRGYTNRKYAALL